MDLKDPGRLVMDKETGEDYRIFHCSFLALFLLLYLWTIENQALDHIQIY